MMVVFFCIYGWQQQQQKQQFSIIKMDYYAGFCLDDGLVYIFVSIITNNEAVVVYKLQH